MKRFAHIIAVPVIVFALILSACDSVNKISSAELKLGSVGLTGNYNPFYYGAKSDEDVISQVYLPVQRRGKDNRLINLCGGITYKNDGDKVKYTVSIRNDLTFSDGTNVTIDDVIFFYYFIADATYDGVYSDWYLNDIEGLKEYYYDDVNYAASLDAIDYECAVRYSKSSVSYDDLKAYLIGSELAGTFSEEISPDGTDWKSYFEKNGLSAEFASLGASPEKSALLELAAKSEADNQISASLSAVQETAVNSRKYDPENWYREKLVKQYIEKNYKNGIDVQEISGIKKINDYSCSVLYDSADINAVSEINPLIVSKAFYSVDYVKGLAEKVRDAEELAPGCGPYVITSSDDGKVKLKANKYYGENPDFTELEFISYDDEDKLFNAVCSGAVDAARVTAESGRLSTLTEKELKYYVSDDDGYYSMFYNPITLESIERKALMGIMNVKDALSAELGSSYSAPLRPLSLRFPEYPSSVTEPFYKVSAFSAYEIMSKNPMKVIEAYCASDDNDFSKLIMEAYKQNLSEKGINMNIHYVPSDSVTEAAASGNADIWLVRVPDGATCDKYDYYNTYGDMNFFGTVSSEADDLTAGIHSSVGFSDRSSMTGRLLDLIMEQALENPVCQKQYVTVYNTKNIDAESFGDSFSYDGFAYAVPVLKSK